LIRTQVTGVTSWLDEGAAEKATYSVRPVVNGVEQRSAAADEVAPFATSMDVPLQIPPGGTTPSGEAYTYSANDASVGDLDGDGQYEIVLKWDPSNAKDNSQSGYTGNVYLDAYKLNGTRLWRVDLGRNIRAGAHYTQFQVFDYDGDGRAEVVVKTADGTRSGTGQVIGNASADHRNSSGYVLAGPEFLSVFRGTDGAVLATADYVVPRGTVSSWGDNYGNRVDRFLAGTAYVDGSRPSIIMARGYYTRSVVVAWDFRNGQLTRRWTFDSNSSTNGSAWTGKGNHQLSIARSCTARWRSTTTAAGCGRTTPTTATPTTSATSSRPAQASRCSNHRSRPADRRTGWGTRAPARSSGARRPAGATTVVASPRTSGTAVPAPRPGRRRSPDFAVAPTGTRSPPASRVPPTS
jgi:hypothetical protein